MALVVLPIRNDLPAYKFKLDLDSKTYVLSFRYNGRMARWFMDLLDESDNQIRMGIKILTNVNLFTILKKTNMPQGDFLAFHETGLELNAERLEFGEEVKLYYNEVE